MHSRVEPLTASRAVASVLSQSVEDLELVLVDDGAPDLVDEVTSRLSDVRIRVVRHATRRGAAAARNTGASAAQAEVIAFLDSDDVWLPTMTERQLAALTSAPASVAGVITSFVLVGASGHNALRRRTFDDLLDETVKGCLLAPGSTLAVRRSVWLELGGEDESLARLEDWDLLLRLAHRGWQLVFVDEPLARVHHSLPGPLPDVVRQSCDSIVMRHLAWISEHSRSGARQFLATADYEIGLAHLRHRNFIRGGPYLLRSVVRAPRITLLAVDRFARRLGQEVGPSH